jgi:hypothetical protein
MFAGCSRANKDADVDALKKQVNQLQSEVAAAKAATTPEPTKKTSVSGAVYYRRRSGDSIILRAITVALVHQSEMEPFDKVMALEMPLTDLSWKSAFVDEGASFFRSFDKTLGRLQDYTTGASSKTTTNVDGKYAFADIDAGNYRLFAILDTSDVKGFWYVDVDVSGEHSVDLNNSNITKVYDLAEQR